MRLAEARIGIVLRRRLSGSGDGSRRGTASGRCERRLIGGCELERGEGLDNGGERRRKYLDAEASWLRWRAWAVLVLRESESGTLKRLRYERILYRLNGRISPEWTEENDV